jgi:hypothetical protein
MRMVRRKLPLFAALPPRARLALHEAVLDEILEEYVVGSPGHRTRTGLNGLAAEGSNPDHAAVHGQGRHNRTTATMSFSILNPSPSRHAYARDQQLNLCYRW